MLSSSSLSYKRRVRSASHERSDEDVQPSSSRSHRRRDLSPRPRSLEDMSHKELHAAIPSLQEHGAELESLNKRIFVRTLVKKKPEWTYSEIHALSRVTMANNRVSVCWDFDHGSVIVDWWAADRRSYDLGLSRRGLRQTTAGAIALSREVLDVIKKARCDDKVYLTVVNAVTLLYQAMPHLACSRRLQLLRCKATNPRATSSLQ